VLQCVLQCVAVRVAVRVAVYTHLCRGNTIDIVSVEMQCVLQGVLERALQYALHCVAVCVADQCRNDIICISAVN